MTYYRLLCLQNGDYMATGYNETTKQGLFDDYKSYKSNDWDETEDEENMFDIWDKMTDDQKMDFIRDDEFEIQESLTAFKEI